MESTHPMHNIAPSGALARRSRQWLQLAFVLVAAGVFIAVVGLTFYVIPLAVPSNDVFPLYNLIRAALLFGGVLVALIGLGLAARATVFTRIDNDLAQVTGRALEHQLDSRYWFVRNINKRELGYIDAVIIGPAGALVFRILDEAGVFANDKASWMRDDGRGGWKPAAIDPTREAVVDIKALRQFLSDRGLGFVPVYGIVVFNRDENETQIVVRDPIVPVANITNLYQRLHEKNGYLTRQNRIDPEIVIQIRDLIYDQ